MKEKFLAGHYGYGHAKTELLNTILEYFGQAREKREALEQNPKYVEDILQEGAKKARAITSKKYRKQKNEWFTGKYLSIRSLHLSRAIPMWDSPFYILTIHLTIFSPHTNSLRDKFFHV